MVTTQARRVQPGQLVQGRARVRNTGNTPAFLGVRVVSGSTGVLGFSPLGSPVVVSTPTQVRPGETAEVRVSVRVPDDPGLADFQLEVGTLGPGGQLDRILDRQTLRGLAEVLREIPLPPPPPEDLTPLQRATQFRDSLGTPNISASPREVNPGQTVRAFVQVPANVPFPFTPQMRLLLLDQNNIPVRTLVDERVTVPQAQGLVRQVDINTTGLTAGRSYGLGLSLTDPLTRQDLLAPLQRANLFSVLSVPVPAVDAPLPEPVGPPPPMPPPDLERIAPITEPIPEVPPLPPPPTPTLPALFPVLAPTLTPTTVVQGGIITGSWTLANRSTQRIRAFLFLEGPAGVRAAAVARDFEPGETNTIRVIERVPLATPPGSAAYRIEVRDANTQRVISDLRRTFTLTVTREAEPEPAPPPPTAQGFIPGNISLVATGPVISSVSAGDSIAIQFTLRNNTSLSGTVDLLAFGIDPTGNTRGTGRTTAALRALDTASPRVNIPIPSGAVPGRYGVRVFISDPRTFVAGDPSTYLVQRTDSDIFTVR